MLKRLFHPPDERGQGLVEYALILMLVAIVVILVVVFFGETVRDIYCEIIYELDPYFNFGTGNCETVGEEAALLHIPDSVIAVIPPLF